MAEFDLWGSRLSPFSNKAEVCLSYAGKSYRRLPAEAGKLGNLLTAKRLQRGKKDQAIFRFPETSPLDDAYPMVPYLLGPDGKIQFDTSGISRWLDEQASGGPRLWPGDPPLSFIAQLIDEAFDEFVLYLLHHQRWIISVKTTWATQHLYEEFRRIPFLPGREKFMLGFARRQVRRLPYTFSIAPSGYDSGLGKDFTPPAMEGWPETHSLLARAWDSCLEGLEAVLSQRPWLLGERFTIADASVFGGLEAIQFEPDSMADIEARVPSTWRWMKRIRDGEHIGTSGELEWSDSLVPLLNFILETFVPLMQQNEAAYLAWVERGETVFNESAHNAGRALYDGELCGYPFRTVVKTFQVQVWRDIIQAWTGLTEEQRELLEQYLPGLGAITGPPGVEIRLA